MAVLKSIVTLFVICLTFLIPIVNCQELQQRKQGSLCSEAFVQINANINTTYIRRTKSNNTCTFYFALDFGHLTDMEVLDKKVNLHVWIDPNNTESWKQPLMVSVRQQFSNTNIKLPYTFEDEQTGNSVWYYSTKRTLCLPKPKNAFGFKRNTKIIIKADTSNELTGIEFHLYLEVLDKLMMDVGEERSTIVSPMAPTYFRYEFGPGVEMIEILYTSSDTGSSICTIVAIDGPFCPIYDMEENIGKVTEYKRMTSAAVTRVRRIDYKRGLVILIIPLAIDNTCTRSFIKLDEESNPKREKNVHLKIRAVQDYDLPWMFGIQLLCIFVPCLFVTLIMFCICDRRLKRLYNDTIQKATDEASSTMLQQPINHITDDSILTYEKIVDEADDSNLRKRYNRYCTITVFISAFYVIPVYQFIYYHWKSMSETGNFDHCYYNELCRVRIHELSDFNHFISNLLYVVFGITFIAFVYWRSCTLFDKPEYLAARRGLRVPFGAYMAMGLSLIMEGILSSAYHFCPSAATFQFDVAFMYVIAIILLSTIHQLRFHASPSGTKGFILLTILTLISALFYVIETRWTEIGALVSRCIFCAVHVTFMVFYCLGLYYHGNVKDSQGKWNMGFYSSMLHVLMPQRLRIKYNFEEMKVVEFANPATRSMKIATLATLFILNAAASIFLAIYEDFAHYLLNLLIMNVFLSTLIYMSWKVFYWVQRNKNSRIHEGISPFIFQPNLYFLLALLFGLCGLRKFNIELTEWRKTAAESRVLNKPCSDFWSNFYDHHDVWHFFSAVALFFSFMGLLTIDDGIIMEDRKNIHLF